MAIKNLRPSLIKEKYYFTVFTENMRTFLPQESYTEIVTSM